MNKIFLFDLDGTLADIKHRLHYLEKPNKSWQKFEKACVDDSLNMPVASVFNAVRLVSKIWIWTGRTDSVREETVSWLWHHLGWHPDVMGGSHGFKMRRAHDYRKDYIVKQEMLDSVGDLKNQIVCVFDDRQQVVDMWRRNDLTCLQVAPGDF